MNKTNTDGQCRWGIMSTAVIGRKNWQSIKNSGNGRVVAVASRNFDTGKKYVEECQSTVPFEQPPRTIEGYAELLGQDDIDAVYIPLPTGLRKEWVIKAAEAGKHVMCEKPCANNANDLQEMINTCQANGVQFMDGVMYMHTQRLAEMRKILDDGTSVGQIRRIATQFSFNGGDEFQQDNIRTNSNLEPFGCLGDLGWYTIRFSLWAMNYEMPTSVVGRMLRGHQRPNSPQPVPMEFSGQLFFANGVSAVFYNSFVTAHQQWANISGSLGQLHLPDFVLPYASNELKFSVTNSEFQVNGCNFSMAENRKTMMTDEAGDSTPNSQETNLFRKFSQIVLSGQLESHWPEISLKTQRVMDGVMSSAEKDGQPVQP